MNPRWAWPGAVLLLAVMALLMVGPAHEESATVDEANEIAAGYLSWKGSSTRIGAEEHPPLAQLLEAAPLLFMDVKFSETTQAMLRGELGYPWTLSWTAQIRPVKELLQPGCTGKYVPMPPLGDVMVQWRCPSSYPIDNWYYWAVPEGQMFGKFFLYEGLNDGDALLFAGRVLQIGLTLLTGVAIFMWTRQVTNHDVAALAALALWVFNPTVLGYGHLTKNDISVTFGMALAAYLFGRFLHSPSLKTAAIAGAAAGVALTMKFTSLILAPVFVVMLILARRKLNCSVRDLGKMAGMFVFAGWCVTLIAFLPHLGPAPPPSSADLTVLNVPAWFTTLRPVLIPAGLFKGVAIALGHTKVGTESYLMGQWKQGGWWYYFPAAFLLKTPVAFVALAGGGLFLFLRRCRSAVPLEQLAWVGAGLYLLSAMTSHINIGVRHLLPMLPMLCVGIGCAVARLTDRWLKLVTLALVLWLAAVSILAYPLYIQFFSEAVGGARNGYKYLHDSNYDWGQDAKRLKKFLDDRQISRIYLAYWGNQFSIEYLKIPNTRVDAETAKQVRQGVLVVSSSWLAKPEWKWLRESRQPNARVAHTLFVYEFP